MGNQTQNTVSKFSQRYLWITMSKNQFKEIMQNKNTREVVEVHRVSQSESQQLKSQSLVYEWRKDPKSITYIVQILEISQSFHEQNKNCIAVCQTNKKQTDLVVYTQNLIKLYEMNSKIQLSQGQQIGIVKDLVEGIDFLSAKFGEFIPSKDSVGYNAKKRGKVWINDNFCLNNLQNKRSVATKQQRNKWQSEIIQTIVEICKLCTIQTNYKNNKFYFALQIIKKNKMNSFSSIRDFNGPQRKPINQDKKDFSKFINQNKPIANKRVEMVNSQHILSSNQFGTAEDPKERTEMKNELKHINKTFDVPMLSPKRNIGTNMSSRTSYNQHNPPLIKFTQKQQKPKPRENYSQLDFQPSFLKPNKAEHNKKKSTSYLLNQNSQKNTIQPKQIYNNTKREVRQKPYQFMLLEELQQSHSSHCSSNIIKKETIQLVDSMQMVERKHNYDDRNGFHRYKHTVLQESIILKSPYM